MDQLFVYVEGFDLEEIEHELVQRFERFIETWGVDGVRLVNDKFDRTPEMREDDLPDWNLGLNVQIGRLPPEKITALIKFLADLSNQTMREFVIGSWSESNQIADDWCWIDGSPKQRDIDMLIEQLR
jgi:hypothetical protein